MNFEDFEGTASIVDRFEKMINEKRNEFFDIHELEAMVEYYMVSANWKRAILCADYGLKLHPESTELLNIKGQALTSGNKLKEARVILEKLRDMEPNNPEIMMNLGSLYWKLERKDQSREMFRKAAELDENLTFETSSILVQQYLMDEEPLEALPYLIKLIEWDTTDDYALEVAVDLFQDLDIYAQGSDFLESLSKKEPNNEVLLYYRALLHGNNNEESKAIYLLEKARKIKENDLEYDINLLLGKMYLETGEFEKAHKATLRAYHLEFEDESARLMAEVELKLGNFHSALDYAEKAYHFDNEYLDNIYILATAYTIVGEDQKAAKMFRKYGKLARPDDFRMERVATALLELGHPNQAIKIFEKSVLGLGYASEEDFRQLVTFCALGEDYERVVKYSTKMMGTEYATVFFLGHLIGGLLMNQQFEEARHRVQELDAKDYPFVFDIFDRYYTEIVEFDVYLDFIKKHMKYGQ